MKDCYKLTIADRSINWNLQCSHYCFCASLLHTQIHVPHAAMYTLHVSIKMSNDRADAWI